MKNDPRDRRPGANDREHWNPSVCESPSCYGAATPSREARVACDTEDVADVAETTSVAPNPQLAADMPPSSQAASAAATPPRADSVEDAFARLAERTSVVAGSFWAFAGALCIVLVWAATGPLFDYSETWQLVINTGTTVITFLMVFVIQHAQNKEMRAVQLKLNEIIAAIDGASNRMIDIEDLSERELQRLYVHYQKMAGRAQKLAADVVAVAAKGPARR
jgi:low affinity Fe/Cu permease